MSEKLNNTEIFGITDKSGFFLTFTENREEAESLVRLCNDNEVEKNQIADIVEDLFYS